MLMALSGPSRPPVAGGKPRRLVILLLLIGCISVVAVWSRQSLEMPRFDLNDVNALKAYFRQIALAGPVPYLLYPFRLVVLVLGSEGRLSDTRR